MVFVMDRQLAQFFAGKITAAFCADPREDLQRPFSVLYFFHSIIYNARPDPNSQEIPGWEGKEKEIIPYYPGLFKMTFFAMKMIALMRKTCNFLK
jgi:hypothetical protein